MPERQGLVVVTDLLTGIRAGGQEYPDDVRLPGEDSAVQGCARAGPAIAPVNGNAASLQLCHRADIACCRCPDRSVGMQS